MTNTYGSSTLLAIAFMVGFFPETGLTAIFEFIRNQAFIKNNIPSLEEKFPLEDLDGINIYHRTRLIDEGIENMENLAHADMVELMLQTRIPLPTLVDWIDQSILFLHLGDAGESSHKKLLRPCGIRTATDLMAAHDAAKNRGEEAAFLGLLGDTVGVKKLEIILDALADDEWMQYLKRWREPERYRSKVLKANDLDSWDE